MRIVDLNLQKLVLSGSRAYGLGLENSDYDYRGIYVGDISEYVGLTNPVKTISDFAFYTDFEDFNGNSHNLSQDTVIYEIRHFTKLVMECNPSVVEILTFPNLVTAWSPIELFCSRLLDQIVCKKLVSNLLSFAHNLVHDTKGKESKLLANALRLALTAKELLVSEVYKPIRHEELFYLQQVRMGNVTPKAARKTFLELDAECKELLKMSKLPSSPDFESVNDALLYYFKHEVLY